MMLADMGAEVVTLDRVGAKKSLKSVAGRGRKIVELDLKDKAAIAEVLDLLAGADALIEGFRPGVMERLGLGPDVVLARNPKLVYGRMTGWGQEGPLANAAGHDINYISVTGALAAIGTKEKPVPPLNLVGDFGGGALYLVVGVLAALLEASKSGKGQVVDTAMCDGAASLSVARAEGEAYEGVQEQDARGLVQDHGRHRHLLRADPHHGRSPEASAHGRAQRLRRAPRRDPARPRPALLAYAVEYPRAGGGGDWRAGEGVEGEIGVVEL
jgi:crotonobetainyl-CoA:carnitine CoA-transferase CaiB-like acyl-CoA transferase